jgi:outer membrane receptor protein involved in Fe transport
MRMKTVKASRPITPCTSLLLALFFLCSSALAAEIHGRVVDETGAAIVHARVEFRAGQETKSTLTDTNGVFELVTAASSGDLTVSAPGFATATLAWQDTGEPVKVKLRPQSVAQSVVVTAERTATPISETAANVVALNATEVQSRAALTVDEALRQVPGFTLFRRNNGFSANPTTQGASARGVGASGASRVLVMQDGIPLNDAFGGWVYWNRSPRIALNGAEVLRGGGSMNYGSGALSGVVDLITRQPANLFTLDAAGDSLSGHDVQGLFAHQVRGWAFSANGETVGNSGAFILLPQDRGFVDTPASLSFSNGSVKVARSLGQKASLFARGSLFSEERNNGTLLQINSTHLGELDSGLNAKFAKNIFVLRVYGSGEHYHQSFSAISTDRNAESLTRWQTVPSDQIGFMAQWSRPLRAAQITAGVDGRFIHGESDETGFTANAATSQLAAGGRSSLVGTFAEIQTPLLRRLRASAGVRADWWSNEDGFSRLITLSNGATTSKQLQSRDDMAISPRAGLVYDIASSWQLTASAYGGFRAPTLNELYRSFRQGNVVTQANELLGPELLHGGEAGLRLMRNRLLVSGVYFQENVDDPIANVTLAVTPQLITRQRQNMGALRARGADADLLLSLPRIQLRAGYEYVHSIVTSFSANPQLVGRGVPQVPAHVFSASTAYAAPQHWTIVGLLRVASTQFDDDQNLLPLAPYSNVGVAVEKQVGPTTWYVSASNLFNAAIQSAATPVFTYASPRVISGGARMTLGPR